MQQTKVADDLLTYLASEDEVVKGLAVWCLGLLRYISAKEDILSLHYDNVDILLYLDGDISICNTGELVKFYLKQIENDHITDSAG